MAIRLIRPWLLVRWHRMGSDRIGPFAAETELYLCEYDVGINRPTRRHVDGFYLASSRIANEQLARMWKRRVRMWPRWLFGPVDRLNRLIPGGRVHNIGRNTKADRDVHHLLDRLPPHLEFTPAERARGLAGLRDMGIAAGERFVCLQVRDRAYLAAHQPGDWSYHDYRDSDIRSYVLAVEALAERGYFVIRMGAKVKNPFPVASDRIIDYAANGMRSDFMDIFLGAHCHFAVSTGSGWDDIPDIFRRPIVYVNYAPLGHLVTFRSCDVNLSRMYWSPSEKRSLTLKETFDQGVAFNKRAGQFEDHGVVPVENTAEEICEAVVEMEERLAGTWSVPEEDEKLQQSFRNRFAEAAAASLEGASLHGEIRARYTTAFLRHNRWWLA